MRFMLVVLGSMLLTDRGPALSLDSGAFSKPFNKNHNAAAANFAHHGGDPEESSSSTGGRASTQTQSKRPQRPDNIDMKSAMSPDSLFQKAESLYNQQKLAEAHEAINLAADASPAAGRVFRLRALIKLALGESVMALTDANYAVTLEPSSPKGHWTKAEALYRLRQYDRALQSAQDSLDLGGDGEGRAVQLTAKIRNKLGITAFSQTSPPLTAVSSPQNCSDTQTAPTEQVQAVNDVSRSSMPDATTATAEIRDEPGQSRDGGLILDALEAPTALPEIPEGSPSDFLGDMNASIGMGAAPNDLDMSHSMYESLYSEDDGADSSNE